MPEKVIKFQEVHPRQRAKWYRVDTDEWPGGSVNPADLAAILKRLAASEKAISVLTSALAGAVSRVVDLETILLNVPSGYLLGRYDAVGGPAQPISIGAGLLLLNDELIATSGSGVVDSFTLECVTDFTDHEVTCVFNQGAFNLHVNQSVSGTDAVTGIEFKANDTTNHVLDLVLAQGVYQLRPNQAVGGAGTVDMMLIRCASPITVKALTMVLESGAYNWKLT